MTKPVTMCGKVVPDKLLCEAVWRTGRIRNRLKKATWTHRLLQDHVSFAGWEYIRGRLGL